MFGHVSLSDVGRAEHEVTDSSCIRHEQMETKPEEELPFSVGADGPLPFGSDRSGIAGCLFNVDAGGRGVSRQRGTDGDGEDPRCIRHSGCSSLDCAGRRASSGVVSYTRYRESLCRLGSSVLKSDHLPMYNLPETTQSADKLKKLVRKEL